MEFYTEEQEKHFFDELSTTTNRGLGQTKELYGLCGKSIFKLIALEEQIKCHLLHYSPGTVEEVEEILALPTKDKTLLKVSLYNSTWHDKARPKHPWLELYENK